MRATLIVAFSHKHRTDRQQTNRFSNCMRARTTQVRYVATAETACAAAEAHPLPLKSCNTNNHPLSTYHYHAPAEFDASGLVFQSFNVFGRIGHVKSAAIQSSQFCSEHPTSSRIANKFVVTSDRVRIGLNGYHTLGTNSHIKHPTVTDPNVRASVS